MNQQWATHLLSFYFFGAQRLRRSEANVEGLAPQPAVSPLGGRVRSSGDSRRSLGGRRVGDGRRDDARFHGGRGGRRLGGGLRLVHIAKTDGALWGQTENQSGKNTRQWEKWRFLGFSETLRRFYLEGLTNPLQGCGLDRRQEAG